MNLPNTDTWHDQWLAERRTGIGGTDIAAIVGVHPYRTALDVFLDKTGQASPVEENLAMRIGKLLEPTIAQLYTEETGHEIEDVGIQYHPRYPFILGTPDRLVKGQSLGLEIKTANARQAGKWGEPGHSDAVPMPYLLQSLWYAAITDREQWDIAVLIGGSDFRIYHIKRDRELEQMLIERAERFWTDHVLTGTPPPLDSSASTAAYLQHRYPTHSDFILPSSTEAETWVLQYQNATRSLEEATAWKEEAKHNLEAIIADAEGIAGDGWKVTWKKTKDSQVISWEDIARAYLPADTLKTALAQYTTTRPGNRRFRLTTED